MSLDLVRRHSSVDLADKTLTVFGGLSASLAELLSSSSVLGKDAFTSSMHSAECMKISDRGRNMLVHTVRIYVCKTYRIYDVTLKIA